jgi:hypothetical protein
MAKRVRKFVDRAFARTVDLKLLRRFLAPYADAIGFSWDNLPEADAARREAVFELFRQADARFPASLQFALFNICCLSTKTGAQYLQVHADEAGVALVPPDEVEGPNDGRHLNPRHLALAAWLDHRAVFDRALDAVAFLHHSAKLELSGRDTGVEARSDDAMAVDGFRAAVSDYFMSRYQGRYCEVRWYHDDTDHGPRALVLHGTKASTKNVDEDGEEQSLTFREIVQDTVEYDTDSGTISVGAKAVPDARKLAGLFAEHLLGDREFFSRADAANFYTLQPINDRGEHFHFSVDDEAEVSRVLIREVRVDEDLVYRNGRRRPSPWSMTVRDNRDALTKLTRLAPDVRFDDVRIVYVKLEVVFCIDGLDSSVIVKVTPPTSASFRDHSHERTILELLERHGIRRLRPAFPAAAAAE